MKYIYIIIYTNWKQVNGILKEANSNFQSLNTTNTWSIWAQDHGAAWNKNQGQT